MEPHMRTWAFPLWFLASWVVLVVKNPLANAGDAKDTGLIPGSGRSPGVGHGNALQYSLLGNWMDRGAWRATVHGVSKNRTQLSRQNTHTHTLSVTLLVQHCHPSSEKAAPVTFLWALIQLIVYCFSIFTHILNYLKEKKDSYRVSQIHLDSFDYHFNYVFAK